MRAAGAHATFFLVGNRLAEWPHVARAETELGVVGNHSWSHPRLTEIPRWVAWLELARTQALMEEQLGWRPKLFRAPYEQHNAQTDEIARSLGLVEVFWSVVSGDDRPKATARSVTRNVLAGLRPGAIVLMHDIHPWTVRALPAILRAIRLARPARRLGPRAARARPARAGPALRVRARASIRQRMWPMAIRVLGLRSAPGSSPRQRRRRGCPA